MKYFTRTLEIRGTLTIGVAAENIDDARKIFDSVIEDEDYSLYDIDVDNKDWNPADDEEVSKDIYRIADCCVTEKESQDILDYVNNSEEDED